MKTIYPVEEIFLFVNQELLVLDPDQSERYFYEKQQSARTVPEMKNSIKSRYFILLTDWVGRKRGRKDESAEQYFVRGSKKLAVDDRVEPGMPTLQGLHVWMFVRSVMVHHTMQIEI